MKPKLSVLVPARFGYTTVRAALDAWDAQTCRDQLEILVLCPAAGEPEAARPGHVIVDTGAADLHRARAIGVERASAAYTMLAEDHCLPDPDWAQAILDRLEDGWDAVGPALRPGNRLSSWTEGSFLLGYGQWMIPVEGGPTDVLCGWNGTIRTELLRELGPELGSEMRVGAFLVRGLREAGQRFYLESRARMRHFDPPGWAREIYLFVIVGLGFGAMRTRRWPLLGRLLYWLATPAIAFRHWWRAWTQYRRAGAAAGLRPLTLAACVVMAAAWACGEAAGAVMGLGRVTPYLWITEIKPVQAEDVDRSDAAEGRTPTAAVAAQTTGRGAS